MNSYMKNDEDNSVQSNNSELNEHIIIGSLDKLLVKNSIARRVSDNQPLRGPTGFISGVRRDNDSDELKVEMETVEAKTRKVSTIYSKESITDLQAIYGEKFNDIFLDFVIDEIAYKLDADFINMLNQKAELKGTLVFDSSYDTAMDSVALSIIMRVNKGLSDLPISDNRSSFGWAVVSSDIGALLSGIIVTSEDNLDNSPSYIGKIGGVDYYIDYTHNNDAENSVIFGIKGNGRTRGSTVYSNYTQNIVTTTSSKDFQDYYVLMDRTALSINPLDKEYTENGEASGFLGKINVDLSGLKIYK